MLDELERVTRNRGVFTVHLQPAKKTLPDGRNAHLILQPAEWWAERLGEHFRVLDSYEIGNGVGVLFEVEPR